MKPLKLSVDVKVSPGVLRLGLAAALVCLAGADLSSESVTLSTVFPAPSGVYTSLITTSGARLERDAGTATVAYQVVVGSGAPAGTRMAVMNGNMGIGTASPGAKLSFNDLNDGSNRADGITWYNPSPTSYGVYRTAGGWNGPDYQQLEAAWATGVIIDGGTAYGKSGTVIQPSAGNVGVGILTPTSKLHVAGTIVARGCAAPVLMTYTAAGGTQFCGVGSYATWSTGFIAKYQNYNQPFGAPLSGQMWCCPCTGACPAL